MGSEPFLIEDKFEQHLATKGALAETALSHLMKILYISRLCHGDVLTTTTFLAQRVHFWSLNEDRWLHRSKSYSFHHADLCLIPNLVDKEGALLDYSLDVELGGDPLHH